MIKKKKNHETKGIVESFLRGIPMIGDLFKELAKTSTFKERFKEVDEKIEENLRKGRPKKWGFEADISIRPIINKMIKKDASEICVVEDYFYVKKGNKLTLAVKVPKEDVELTIINKILLISSDNFEKKVKLPDYYRNFKKKQYNKGILVLELRK